MHKQEPRVGTVMYLYVHSFRATFFHLLFHIFLSISSVVMDEIRKLLLRNQYSPVFVLPPLLQGVSH